jgi:DNA-binding response OmpR family regulator
MSTILLIDHDAATRGTARRTLVAAGYDVVELGNGEGCEEAVTHHRPDLVLTKVVMPGRDGIEVVRGLRKAHPGLRVLVMGAGAARSGIYTKAVLSFGADCAVGATLEGEALLRSVADILARQTPCGCTRGVSVAPIVQRALN